MCSRKHTLSPGHPGRWQTLDFKFHMCLLQGPGVGTRSNEIEKRASLDFTFTFPPKLLLGKMLWLRKKCPFLISAKLYRITSGVFLTFMAELQRHYYGELQWDFACPSIFCSFQGQCMWSFTFTPQDLQSCVCHQVCLNMCFQTGSAG